MRVMRRFLGHLYAVIPVGILVAAYLLGARCERQFEKQDPKGYAKYMEEVREEGIPDPRR